jgi:glycosyltransferase involved in cell wall biosynthesis
VTRAVHQLLATFAPHDAVSNEARQICAVLRAAGYESEIYAAGIRPSAHDVVRPLNALAAGADDVLICHYSIWSEAVDRALAGPGRLVVRYHNVTPAHWLEGVNEVVAALCRSARARLGELAPRAALALADSSFNRLDLDDAGFGRSEVLPILLPPATPLPPPAPAAAPLIVSVGRLVPNKRIDELLRTFACYRRTCAPDAGLAIVGAADGFEAYALACRRLAEQLGIADPFAGRLDDAARDALLARAAAYLVCSEHEGFCVPLVEAMRAGLPIVARDFGAVAETLGGAGIAAPPEAGPAELAELLDLAVTDEGLRAAMASGRAERLAALDPAVVGGRLLELLGGVA